MKKVESCSEWRVIADKIMIQPVESIIYIIDMHKIDITSNLTPLMHPLPTPTLTTIHEITVSIPTTANSIQIWIETKP